VPSNTAWVSDYYLCRNICLLQESVQLFQRLIYLGLVFVTDSIFIHTVTDLKTPAFFILLSAALPNSRYFKLSVTDCTDDGLNKHKHIIPRR